MAAMKAASLEPRRSRRTGPKRGAQGLALARCIPESEQTGAKIGFASPSRRKVLGCGELLRDPGEGHIAVFAPTGAGKSRNLLIPMLLSSDQPAIVLDVKGELARTTARYRREALGHKTFVLDPWKVVTEDPDSFNPLDILSADDPGLPDDAYALARLLIDEEGRSREAFWDESSQALIAGLIAYAVGTPKENDRSFARVWEMLHGSDATYDLAVTLDTVKDIPPYAYAQIAGHLQVSADVTRSGIMAVVRQHMRLFGSPLVQQSVRNTSLDLDLICRGGATTIYLVVPPSKLRSHAALLRLWLSALMTLFSQRNAAPEAQTLLILDEVAQLGRMEQVVQAVTLMRGFGVRCVLLLQSYAQLKQLYPEEHEVFLENCGTLLTFGHTAFGMSKQMADALGDISPEVLFRMERDQLALRLSGQNTQIALRLDYLADPEFQGRFDHNPMYPPAPGTSGAPGIDGAARVRNRANSKPTLSL